MKDDMQDFNPFCVAELKLIFFDPFEIRLSEFPALCDAVLMNDEDK